MSETVYEDMHLKDLLGSITRVGYCIRVPHFYLALHGLRCWKSTIIDSSITQGTSTGNLKQICAAVLKQSNMWYYIVTYNNALFICMISIRVHTPCSHFKSMTFHDFFHNFSRICIHFPWPQQKDSQHFLVTYIWNKFVNNKKINLCMSYIYFFCWK